MDKLTRRDTLKISGMTLGALMLGNLAGGCGNSDGTDSESPEEGDLFIPGEPLGANEMRISFMGTSFLPRIKQECNSVFVELGNGDCFVFDCGSGISAKYVAMGVPYSKMTNIFLTHLHGDHMSDIITIYCFGPSLDRKTPLNIYGPSANNPAEGLNQFCSLLRELTAWHVESFSFISTGLLSGGDGYDINPVELPYMEVGTAYEANGVKITHFPAVHARDGSISYKLEWNGLSMVFSGDTKPNTYMIENAKGVDVLIHEMVVPPEVWVSKNNGPAPGEEGYEQALALATAVQESSHTPQKALGYILSKTSPRLGVATHFQADEYTIQPAINDVRKWYSGPFSIATDLLVLNVSKGSIRQRMAKISDLAWYPPGIIYSPSQMKPPKYPTPTSQLNDELLEHVIPESEYDG